ncbi:DUF4127 family protein [Paenibacillus sp. IITD108]|uniref:DUF4127 family protein n=1 Tax=Paenibacillus sp. IITD108 TaxID=3116649 RepID=UPI002F413037
MGKVKIAYLPLDERPCNYEFPYLLASGTSTEVVRPDLSIMGKKKKPGNVEAIGQWLEEQCKDADGLIVSIDTLLYGGIIPSRLHSLTAEECSLALEKLRLLKSSNPKLKIFAFHLIMRCPRYSSSDEEPDYYEDYGREIFLTGYLSHRKQLNLATEQELEELARLEGAVPEPFMQDYLGRRSINIQANQKMLGYVEEGIVDFLIIPQDDSAPFGLTALDQQKVRDKIAEHNMELRALMYPGADEAGCTLMARMLNEFNNVTPYVYPRLSGVNSAAIIPLYEDRPLFESIKYQILAAGGQIASSAQEADCVLLVNAPGDRMLEANDQLQTDLGYQVMRNTIELVEYGSFIQKRFAKPVAIADVAYANGGDLQLLKLLKQKNMLFDIAGYAGWNTSSNTLGTVIAQMMIYHIYGNSQEHLNFLALRYTEDLGYCSKVRRAVALGAVKEKGLSYFGVDGERGSISSIVKDELLQFVITNINDERHVIHIQDVYMPWNRMFEVGLSVRVQSQIPDR